jgi:HTH-type transcriptional regulator/antitoxin HipB
MATQPIRSAEQLGVAIREERVRRGLTQHQLADLTGTGQKTISRIENGHEGATLETVFKLLAVLQLQIRFSPRDVGLGNAIGDIF